MNVPDVETYHVQDATKIQAFMRCPRQYFFNYVLGWQSVEPNIHLVFGSAWHEAMEHLLTTDYSSTSILEAYAKFLRLFDAEYPLAIEGGTKTPENALNALAAYAAYYKQDSQEFTVLHTEVAGSILLFKEEQLFFKIDTIVRHLNGTQKVSSIEHKTTSSFSMWWTEQWRQKFQIGVYTYVLQCLYGEEEVDSIIINATKMSSPPRLKKDGTPYANDQGPQFMRVPIRMSTDRMVDWFTQARYWLAYIKSEFQALEKASDTDPVLLAFPKLTESCIQYGKACPFLDYCIAAPNPLKYVDRTPVGIKVSHWDPRHAQETAKEVVKL